MKEKRVQHYVDDDNLRNEYIYSFLMLINIVFLFGRKTPGTVVLL